MTMSANYVASIDDLCRPKIVGLCRTLSETIDE